MPFGNITDDAVVDSLETKIFLFQTQKQFKIAGALLLVCTGLLPKFLQTPQVFQYS